MRKRFVRGPMVEVLTRSFSFLVGLLDRQDFLSEFLDLFVDLAVRDRLLFEGYVLQEMKYRQSDGACCVGLSDRVCRCCVCGFVFVPPPPC